MPNYVLNDIPNGKMTEYADDSSVHVHSMNIKPLKENLEKVADQMISYCRNAGLILNSEKTQFLISPKQECQIRVGSSIISSSQEMNLVIELLVKRSI